MSIVGRLLYVLSLPSTSHRAGYMPVAGYNYGAGRFDRVRKAFFFTLKVTAVLMTISGIAGFAAAPFLIRLFIRNDADVVAHRRRRPPGHVPRHAPGPPGCRLQHDLSVHRKVVGSHGAVPRPAGNLFSPPDSDAPGIHRTERGADHPAPGRCTDVSELPSPHVCFFQGART